MYQNCFVDRSQKIAYIWDDAKGMVTLPFKKYAYKKDPAGIHRSIYGDKLTRINKFNPKDTTLFESDVPDSTRILVDVYTESDTPSTGHVVFTFDIETDTKDGYPDVVNASNEIISIAGYDSLSKEYFVFALDAEGRLDDYEERGASIEIFDNEKNLLERFLNRYEEICPTIITGWNCDFFDIPYLYNRISRVMGQHEANRLSPIGKVYFSPYRNRYFIAGVSCLDYLMMYKKYTYSVEPSYRLDAIGTKELGIGKVQYEGTLDDLYTSDLKKFIDYNLVDVEIVVKLDEKLQFIELVRGICHAGHVPYEDFIYSSKYLEGAILTQLKKKELVAPNKPADREKNMVAYKDRGTEKGFIGAYVKEPIPGKYDWIYGLDLTSLYPSIIMSLNISPETKLAEISDWDGNEYAKRADRTYDINGTELSKDDFFTMIDDNKISVAANGVLYRTDKKGLIPEILEGWFSQRMMLRNQMNKYGEEGNDKKYQFYKKRVEIYKVLLNSLYGVLGLPAFRFYDLANAEAVTTTGRSVIKFSANMINEYYNKELGAGKKDHVIYIDTDSTYVSGLPLLEKREPDIDMTDEKLVSNRILDIAAEVQDYLNHSYDFLAKKIFNLDKHRFEIKREYVAKSGFWISKKRYAQWIINDNGLVVDRIGVKGMDVVRSSFPKAFRELMSDILKDILEGTPKEEVDEKILEFRKNLHELPLSDIAKVTSVKNMKKYKVGKDEHRGVRKKGTPAHVKASFAFNELLKHFNIDKKHSPIRSGDKVKWIYLKQNPLNLNGMAFRGYEDPPQVIDFIKKHADYDKIFERELESKLKDFYTALGWIMVSAHLKNASKFFDFK